MDDWPQWRSKIVELAKTESSTRPNIKKVLQNLQESDKEGSFMYTITCIRILVSVVLYIEYQDANGLELLCKLLYPRGFGRNVIFIKNYEVSTE